MDIQKFLNNFDSISSTFISLQLKFFLMYTCCMTLLLVYYIYLSFRVNPYLVASLYNAN